MKISECIEKYVNDNKSIKKSTIHNYMQRKNIMLKVLGDFETELINSDFLQECIKKLEDAGYKYTTVSSCINLIKTATEINVDKKMHYKHEIAETDKKFYTKEEIKAIQNHILNHPKETFTPIIIAINTGMRIGEIVALKWADIDFENNIISVNKNCSLGEITTTKTLSGVRKIPLRYDLKVYLKQFKNKPELFVCNNSTKPKEIRGIERTNERLLIKLNIEPKGMHAYRHSFATELLNVSDNYKAITEIMGHTRIEITQNIYRHASIEDKADIVNKAIEPIKRQYKQNVSNKKISELQDQVSNLTNTIEKMTALINNLCERQNQLTMTLQSLAMQGQQKPKQIETENTEVIEINPPQYQVVKTKIKSEDEIVGEIHIKPKQWYEKKPFPADKLKILMQYQDGEMNQKEMFKILHISSKIFNEYLTIFRPLPALDRIKMRYQVISDFVNKKYECIEHIADDLMVSESTIKKHLKGENNLINKMGFQITKIA